VTDVISEVVLGSF